MDLIRNITDVSQKIFHLDQHRSHEDKVGDEFTDVTVKVRTLSDVINVSWKKCLLTLNISLIPF